MNRALSEYYRCPDEFARLETDGSPSGATGFFKFGEELICYGQYSGGAPAETYSAKLPDAWNAVNGDAHPLRLPFDLQKIADNLRFECYSHSANGSENGLRYESGSRQLYYFLRPILPVRLRKHLQRMRLKGWEKIPFPHWPVDFTVDALMEQGIARVLKAGGPDRVPFIWFWPGDAPSCAMMTHDVEALAGRKFCHNLMDLDDSFGIKSSFQIVPEGRYPSGLTFLESIWKKGFEVNVHDLNHDGSLFREKSEFLRRAAKINQYVTKFHARGFRSGAMYRNQDWFGAFDFSYDMSVPNVAHLEPQCGGCCTVMPFFIGKILELPLTTIQDYSLFHILGDYSIDLWKQQIELILQRNGLISFITHPDYLKEPRAQHVYRNLLAYLVQLRRERNVWIALPADVDRWWRSRSQMRLSPAGQTWRIEGPDADRARIAYASLREGRVIYTIGDRN